MNIFISLYFSYYAYFFMLGLYSLENLDWQICISQKDRPSGYTDNLLWNNWINPQNRPWDFFSQCQNFNF